MKTNMLKKALSTHFFCITPKFLWRAKCFWNAPPVGFEVVWMMDQISIAAAATQNNPVICLYSLFCDSDVRVTNPASFFFSHSLMVTIPTRIAKDQKVCGKLNFLETMRKVKLGNPNSIGIMEITWKLGLTLSYSSKI